MAVVKVIELLGESEQSWEDATKQVIAEATKTLSIIDSVYTQSAATDPRFRRPSALSATWS